MPNVRKNRQINILHLYSSSAEIFLEIFAPDQGNFHDNELAIQVDVHQDDIQNIKKSVVFAGNSTETFRYNPDLPTCEGEIFSNIESFSHSSVIDRLVLPSRKCFINITNLLNDWALILIIRRSNFPQKSLFTNWFTINTNENCQYSYKIFHEIYQEDEITDLKQIRDPLPNIDLFILPIGNPKELTEFLNQKAGIWSWKFQRFWNGFFPILIIEIISEEDQNDNTTEEEHIWKKLEIIFSVVRKIQIKNIDFSKEKLLEVIAEFIEFIEIIKSTRLLRI